jgi:hypothetical protein
MFKNKKYVRTIIRIPDDMWNEIKNILPDEKPDNTIGRSIVPYRKVLDGILFVSPLFSFCSFINNCKTTLTD